MSGIDSASVARPEGRPDPRGTRFPEVLAALASEFFVEWQVADHAAFAPGGAGWEK